MNTKELEALLEGGIETPRIEFKSCCEFHVRTFAKGILAMSNIRDGGYIIVGVRQLEDDSFKREGINDDVKKSFKFDDMKDKLAPFTDPHVEFTVEIVKDRENKEYAVIRIFQFNEIPVICCKTQYDLKEGVIYYRSQKGKVSSAPVSNSFDMRDMITNATIKMMQRVKEYGFTVGESVKGKLDDEIEDVSKERLIEKIKRRGYWRINFQPLIDVQKLSSIRECEEIIEKNTVNLRGWDYPHFPRRKGDDTGLEREENFLQGWIDWEDRLESWRLYLSGQFIHHIALWEDWPENSKFNAEIHKKIKPLTSLEVIESVIYQITIMFEFLSRFGSVGVYDEGVFVSVGLFNTKNRKLWFLNPERYFYTYKYTTEAKKIEFSEKFSKDVIISEPKNLALKVIKNIFDKFGWNPSVEQIKNDQDKLLSGRI